MGQTNLSTLLPQPPATQRTVFGSLVEQPVVGPLSFLSPKPFSPAAIKPPSRAEFGRRLHDASAVLPFLFSYSSHHACAALRKLVVRPVFAPSPALQPFDDRLRPFPSAFSRHALASIELIVLHHILLAAGPPSHVAFLCATVGEPGHVVQPRPRLPTWRATGQLVPEPQFEQVELLPGEVRAETIVSMVEVGVA